MALALATSHKKLVLGKKLAAGGQGEVWEVKAPSRKLVFKRFLPDALGKEPDLPKRLDAMLRVRPAGITSAHHVAVAWPTDTVLDGSTFVGLVMPSVDVASAVELHDAANPSSRKRDDSGFVGGFTWEYLGMIARNLAHAVGQLHAAGIVIGDFNERNILVHSDARVTLIDCDSMQIRDTKTDEVFLCKVGRPEFTPPELLRADWQTTVRDSSSDLFALAIHIHQLLLEGEHPFRGRWSGGGDKPSVPELASSGSWAHAGNSQLGPRDSAIAINVLPRSMIDLFRRAFVDGAKRPRVRPSAQEWFDELSSLVDNLTNCSDDSDHRYPSRHRRCPWCRHQAKRPNATAAPSTRNGLAGSNSALIGQGPAVGGGPGRRGATSQKLTAGTKSKSTRIGSGSRSGTKIGSGSSAGANNRAKMNGAGTTSTAQPATGSPSTSSSPATRAKDQSRRPKASRIFELRDRYGALALCAAATVLVSILAWNRGLSNDVVLGLTPAVIVLIVAGILMAGTPKTPARRWLSAATGLALLLLWQPNLIEDVFGAGPGPGRFVAATVVLPSVGLIIDIGWLASGLLPRTLVVAASLAGLGFGYESPWELAVSELEARLGGPAPTQAPAAPSATTEPDDSRSATSATRAEVAPCFVAQLATYDLESTALDAAAGVDIDAAGTVSVGPSEWLPGWTAGKHVLFVSAPSREDAQTVIDLAGGQGYEGVIVPLEADSEACK